MTYQTSFKILPVAAVVLTLAACGSSSSSDPLAPMVSQAVDGYVVGGAVTCDNVSNGITRKAGKFSCPGGSILSQVTGGYDVGFDELATTGVAFTGVLKAPASEPFVTPMTTVSVAMALSSPGAGPTLNLGRYRVAQASLAETLSISVESFTKNPAEHTDVAKSNAKIHQVLTAFAQNTGEYDEAAMAFAAVIAENAATGGKISLTADIPATLASINTRLAKTDSKLELATADLNQAAVNVTNANGDIDKAQSPAKVAAESEKARINQAPVTIDRNDAMVSLYNDALRTSEQLAIEGFESAIKTDGLYTAKLYSGLTRVGYDNDVFQFNQNINDTRVSVAFEVKSVNSGDSRSLLFTSDDIVVSANKGRSESLMISMYSPQSVFQAMGRDAAGVVTEIEVEPNGDTFSSNGDMLTINLERINKQLSDLGFEDILARDGDYSVTLVINGLRINEQMGNTTVEAKEFTVGSGASTVTGHGFRGYVSVIR